MKRKKRRNRTVKLDKPRAPPSYGRDGRDFRYWNRSLPFFHASAGILLHRVRNVLEFIRDGKVSHTAVHYLCGNSSFVRRGSEFSADPKKAGRLVCTACEFRAQRQRLPSADKLTGHHCHVGRLVAVQTCCCNHEGSDL